MMYTNDDDDYGKVDSHEQYEESVLDPLRRRLSDAGSTISPMNTSQSTTTKLPLAFTVLSDHQDESYKENERNVTLMNSYTNVIISNVSSSIEMPPISETKVIPHPPNQCQPAKTLKSW